MRVWVEGRGRRRQEERDANPGCSVGSWMLVGYITWRLGMERRREAEQINLQYHLHTPARLWSPSCMCLRLMISSPQASLTVSGALSSP